MVKMVPRIGALKELKAHDMHGCKSKPGIVLVNFEDFSFEVDTVIVVSRVNVVWNSVCTVANFKNKYVGIVLERCQRILRMIGFGACILELFASLSSANICD